jgi:TonB-dependent receptor
VHRLHLESRRLGLWIALVAMLISTRAAFAQQTAGTGTLRGVVRDADFDVPLPAARVRIQGTSLEALTSDQGTYIFAEVPAGTYTLVCSKDGYERQVKADVVVSAAALTDVDFALVGEVTELEEFVVQDTLQLGAGTEEALLGLRLESAAFLDSIGSDLMSRAGASDAASALKLVAGASVQDGKSAVIRGLPDRYVANQMNGVRLPSADQDKRAVELDQFPAAVIESIQVSKTFTPDQQGDASGGAVNIRLRGIPQEPILQFKSQVGYNSQAGGESDFLTYKGGGLDFFGTDGGDRDPQLGSLGKNWTGAVGVSEDDAPIDSKWSAAIGGRRELEDGVDVGGFAGVFYERDSSFYDDGIDDSWWVPDPASGSEPSPQTTQGAPDPSGAGDYKTALFDTTQGSQSVRWGGLGIVGIETERNSLALTYLHTHTAEDKATLAEDTRGKEFFFPGYDPNDPAHPGNQEVFAAPYLRTETLEYTERTTETLQLSGRHTLSGDGFDVGSFDFGAPEFDWVAAKSKASELEPDKRQFGSFFLPGNPGVWQGLKPNANINLGNLQRTWKEIEEESDQYSANLKLPFEQWSGEPGYVKLGVFDDHVERTFDQDTFSNFGDSTEFAGFFEDFWSAAFPSEPHPILDGPPFVDVDYDAEQDVSAWYAMIDMPVAAPLDLIGGVRFEDTSIDVILDPEEDALWFPKGATQGELLDPGEADVHFRQEDALPSIGLVYEPIDVLTLRAAYSRTVARQTFKELTPILQQDYLGGPIFIGNPELEMSSLRNYDLRADYRPYPGGLLSVSWFKKDIEDAIEYVQQFTGLTFTTARNYPEGELSGYELEARQDLGELSERLDGLGVGANATFIDSSVTLPEDEVTSLAGVGVNLTERDATNAPEHLYNLFLTYDVEATGTKAALFYTVQGDTLVAGAAEERSNFVPSVYAKEFDTLNLVLSQKIGSYLTVFFEAKNLTNPEIEEVYRSQFLDGDLTKTRYTKGIDFALGLSLTISL